MSDVTLNAFVARGTTAERTAFVPDPPSPAVGPAQAYVWWDEDLQTLYAYDFGLADWVATGGGGAGHTHVIGETAAGDGVTTAFVLASTPTAGTVAAYINGVRVMTFTVLVDTVTFTAAPANGDEIVFDYIT